MKPVSILVVALALSLAVLGQGRPQGGGSRTSGNMGEQKSLGSQHGRMTGQMDQMRDRERQRIHATTQQRQQIRDCTQSSSRLRKQVRDMARLKKGTAVGANQAQQWREQLRTEIQNMNQEQQRMLAGLTPEQRAATRDHVQEMEQSRERLQKLSDALGFALDEESVNGDKVRDQARDMQAELDRMRQHQRSFEDQLAYD